MTGQAIITYRGQTIHYQDVAVDFPRFTSRVTQDLTRFTNAQLEEANQILDAIIESYKEEAFREFNRLHPNGGTFFLLPDGTLCFKDADPLQIPVNTPAVTVHVVPKNC